MKVTMTPARALVCAPAAASTCAHDEFRGATPFGASVEGTSVSRLRTAAVIAQDKTNDQAMGPAARGRPL